MSYLNFLYLIIGVVLGFLFMGVLGIILGGFIGILYGTTQSNQKLIKKLEKQLNELNTNNT
ncbi:hypothetical protein E3U55_09720 [Filobacillus milosensis]|uniref:Uncharacterized protein n=1 Tax=Filobacillus milosensis TaxID=94137 RepID=A0A4Y8IRP4_9BACI|nr:hypothetical protein [Filobacillus milosensis]TFB21090.1 hypothetical protein E3U55_09720 [Filobacillus milosensis]